MRECAPVRSAGDVYSLVGGIFCDLKKAFNCVNHNSLLNKLEHYGITGINKALYKSYL